MRFAAIADIHGNALALEAVLADIAAQGITDIVNLGDCFSGPLEAGKTADRLLALNLPTVRGNHDRYLTEFSPEHMQTSDEASARSGGASGTPAVADQIDVLPACLRSLMTRSSPSGPPLSRGRGESVVSRRPSLRRAITKVPSAAGIGVTASQRPLTQGASSIAGDGGRFAAGAQYASELTTTDRRESPRWMRCCFHGSSSGS